MKRTILALAILAVPQLAIAEGPDCNSMMEMHGMLTRAQFQCGYSKYSNALLDLAKVCYNTIGAEEAKKHITSGMKTFDANEQKLGHATLCASILKDFPQYVHK